ncbi:MucBP domain-containing protein, partial [Pseudogracilibacillus sp. SO30301A]|uniref:MucBP domain-containing protein n=1 Tax=Pseudogracilibacillus sp. SO30301A TaxID=3098291 RepID=UPI00300DFD5C
EYVDENGNPIADSDTLTGEVGSPYTTTLKQIGGYELIQKPDNANGTFTKDRQTVTYVYAPVKGPDSGKVVVKYVDEDGNPLADPDSLTGEVDSPYETKPKDLNGYKLVKTPDNATGKFTEEEQTVTYVYKPVNPEGTVAVKYVDENGKPLADLDSLTGEVGSPYETSPKKIDGYELVKTPDNATGKFTEEEQTVTYVYKPVNPEGTVVVEYVDEDGNSIVDPDTLTGEVGSPYETSSKEIEGYELIKKPKNATGVFAEDGQIVTYVYAPITGEIPGPEDGVDSPGSEKGDDGQKLPNTATNIYNLIAIGLILVLIGLLFSYRQIRRNN